MVAGIAGVAAPATLFAGQRSGTPRNAPAAAELFASGSGGEDKLVVCGRILGAPDCRPLAGATVEVWRADANGDYSGDYSKIARGKQDDPGRLPCASVTTDADGRFMFTTVAPAEYLDELSCCRLEETEFVGPFMFRLRCAALNTNGRKGFASRR